MIFNVKGMKNFVELSRQKLARTASRRRHNTQVGKRRYLQQDSDHLRFAVELSRYGSGDLNRAVQQRPQVRRSSVCNLCLNRTSRHEQIEEYAPRRTVSDQVGCTHNGMHRRPPAVQVSTDQRREIRGCRQWRRTVTEKRHASCQNLGPEARSRDPLNQNAVSGLQPQVRSGLDINGCITILHKKVDISLLVVGDRPLKQHRDRLCRSFIRDRVDGRQRSQRRALLCAQRHSYKQTDTARKGGETETSTNHRVRAFSRARSIVRLRKKAFGVTIAR
ncbi:MAG TPA: hypothetical protein VHE33_13425 [Acidobacteriaceae bacterium]|nr:hypothetical protein [Acidobacteriaceae bacterium]